MTIYSKPAKYGTIAEGDVIEPDHMTDLYDALYDTILPGGITADQLATGSVTADAIAASAVTTVKIAPDAITATEIDDGAVTVTKLADGCLTKDVTGRGKMADGFVDFTHVSNGISQCAVGYWDGDGSSPRDVTTITGLGGGTAIGFDPTFVLACGGVQSLTVKTEDNPSGESLSITAGSSPNYITELIVGGFTVESFMNASGTRYYFIAFNSTAV